MKVKTYTDQPVQWAEEKLDGYRVTLDHLAAYSRQANKLDLSFMDLPLLDEGTVVVGELYIPGKHATSVKTFINNKDERLRFVAFAIPYHKGEFLEDMPVGMSRFLMNSLGFSLPQFRRLSKEPKPLEIEKQRDLIQYATDAGWEGWVLKEANYKGWYRLKGTNTVDAVVIQQYTSTSVTKFGLLKAVDIVVYDKDRPVFLGKVGNGFDDDFRKDAGDLVGRVCEVEFDSLAANGKLKFARFLRWRDDKTAKECTKDQISHLLPQKS